MPRGIATATSPKGDEAAGVSIALLVVHALGIHVERIDILVGLFVELRVLSRIRPV
jgi:hypothetical protein